MGFAFVLEVAKWSGIAAVVLGVCFVLWLLTGPKAEKFPVSDVPEDRVCKQGFTIKKVPDGIDVIIIGSGIGGLTTGALLAKEGKRVLVLEQHTMAGGNTHTFEEHGYEFDTGLHYIGGKVGIPGSPNRQLWDYVTDGGVQWARMDDVYDRVIRRATATTGGDGANTSAADNSGYANSREEIQMHTDIKKLIENLKTKFPDESKDIDAYFKLVRKAAKVSMPLYVASKVLPTFVMSTARRLLPSYFELLEKTTEEILTSVTKNRKLRGVLAYSYGDFGEAPSRAAFVMNAVIVSHYIGGAYYPVGGPSVIPNHMVRVIERYSGGRVLVRAPVTRIIVENGRAVGVEVKGKHELRAPIVVSSVGAPNTFMKLLPKDLQAGVFQKEISLLHHPSIAANISLMSLFVGFKGTVEELGLPRGNLWMFPSWDHESLLDNFRKNPEAELPAVFLSFSSAKDPTYAKSRPGKQTALVIGPSIYEHVEKYREGRIGKRGSEYESLKAVFQEKLMAALLEEFPQVEGKVEYVRLRPLCFAVLALAPQTGDNTSDGLSFLIKYINVYFAA